MSARLGKMKWEFTIGPSNARFDSLNRVNEMGTHILLQRNVSIILRPHVTIAINVPLRSIEYNTVGYMKHEDIAGRIKSFLTQFEKAFVKSKLLKFKVPVAKLYSRLIMQI